MSQAVLNALRSKLISYESAGMDDMVRRVKDRIARIEKAAEPKAVAASAPATPKKSTAKPTTKKAAKKAGR